MPNSSRSKEKIDERILRLIGLEDVFDLDYDTYKLLIKEVLVKISLGKHRIPDEERNLLVDELKRIRSGGKKGRFEVNAKKTKINSSSFAVKKISNKISGKKMLTGTFPKISASEQKNSFSRSLEKDVAVIRASVESIYESLALQQSLLSNQYEKDRRQEENANRNSREDDLEKKTSILKKVTDKLLSPVKSILSKIIDFFIKMIFGRAIMKLIDWVSDPQNRSKVSSIFKFLNTFWPALLSAYILFGTKLGSFAGSLIASVGGFLLRLTRFAIPGLLRFIARHPVGAAAVALGTFGLWGPEVIPGLKSKDQKEDPEDGYAFKGGGGTDGLVQGKKGVDQINARLSDGEFVMSPGAVKLWGADTFARMNVAGGGTNKPKIYGGKTYAAEGGPFGRQPRPENAEISPLGTLDRLREYIKSSTGYDASKPGTWAKSFGTGISGMFGGKGGSSRSSGGESSLDPLINQGQGLANQGLGLLSAAADPRSYQGLLPKGSGGLLEQGQKFVNDLFTSKKPTQQPSGSGGNPILAGLGKFIGGIANNPYFGETAIVERERKLGLMKPGADALTKETKDRLAKSDNWIKSLYDPKKDKGPLGNVKKLHQDIQDKGFIADPLSLLKTEEFEKGVEKISGGRVKNFGASAQGVQMSLKALAGPLGRMFRVEDQGSLGRYLRPAMMEAQKRGHGNVGAKALGQDLYNKLLPNKLANFALGQTAFGVDKSGRAMTGITGTSRDETWDFNQTAEKNFGQSRQALKAFGNILQGKGASIGEGKNIKKLTGPKGALKALYEAGFKGMSGIYRTLQNTAYGNLRPMGSNIDLGGGFKQTDARGNVLSPQQIKQSQNKSRFTKPKNSVPGAVKPPTKAPVTVVSPGSSSAFPKKSAQNRRGNNRNRSSASFPAGNGGSKKILNIV